MKQDLIHQKIHLLYLHSLIMLTHLSMINHLNYYHMLNSFYFFKNINYKIKKILFEITIYIIILFNIHFN